MPRASRDDDDVTGGPSIPGSGLIVGTRPWALFRSSDAGGSWQAVWNATGYPDRENRTSLALSPGFAQDGTILRTPAPIVATLNEKIRAILKTPEGMKRWQDRGFDVVASTPEEMTAHLQREIKKWRVVFKEQGIKAE